MIAAARLPSRSSSIPSASCSRAKRCGVRLVESTSAAPPGTMSGAASDSIDTLSPRGGTNNRGVWGGVDVAAPTAEATPIARSSESTGVVERFGIRPGL